MAIEIVDFPIKNGGSFHCHVAVHQRVYIAATPPAVYPLWQSIVTVLNDPTPEH